MQEEVKESFLILDMLIKVLESKLKLEEEKKLLKKKKNDWATDKKDYLLLIKKKDLLCQKMEKLKIAINTFDFYDGNKERQFWDLSLQIRLLMKKIKETDRIMATSDDWLKSDYIAILSLEEKVYSGNDDISNKIAVIQDKLVIYNIPKVDNGMGFYVIIYREFMTLIKNIGLNIVDSYQNEQKIYHPQRTKKVLEILKTIMTYCFQNEEEFSKEPDEVVCSFLSSLSQILMLINSGEEATEELGNECNFCFENLISIIPLEHKDESANLIYLCNNEQLKLRLQRKES